MKAEKKKMNTYLKFGLKILVFVFIGGMVGIGSVYFDFHSLGGLVKTAADVIREYLLPVQAFLLLLDVLIGESALHKFRALGNALENAEDEQSDRIEYEMEQISSVGMISSIGGMVLAMILLSTGYSMDYIESLSETGNRILLSVFALFILNSIYNGYWQVRYVKSIQKFYPQQKADITSRKFQKQWLENCDEAEREMIYQASYQTYLCIHELVSVLAVVAMLSHLLWDTGIMAVVLVGIIWIAMTVSYCRACVKKKGSKLNT